MRVLLLGFISVVWLRAMPLQADDEVSGENPNLWDAAKFAVISGNLDLLQALLKAKLQINSPIDPSGETLLHYAVRADKLEVIRYLIKQGANPLVRSNSDTRPIDYLDWDKPGVTQLIQTLERSLTSFDKTTLAGVPVPVWREVLGPVVSTPDPFDPLEPPPQPKAGEKKLVQYIAFQGGGPPKNADALLGDSFKGGDPPKELEAMLNSRFPGWKPFSTLNRQSNEPCESIQITFAPVKSTDISTDDHGPLITYVQQHPLPAYSFKVHRWRWGQYGYVVLIGGYWVKVAPHMFEE